MNKYIYKYDEKNDINKMARSFFDINPQIDSK